MTDAELRVYAKEIQAPYSLLKETATLKRLPVVNFAAGGIATPAAWLRWGLCGQRCLQVRRREEACSGDRTGCHPLPRRQSLGRGLDGFGRRHGGNQLREHDGRRQNVQEGYVNAHSA